MKCSSAYYSAFKEIRNRLRYFRKDQIAIVCFENLVATWDMTSLDVVQNKLPMPWHTLLILKWGMVYGANKVEGKQFDQNKFLNLYNLVSELPANFGWLNNNDSLSVWKLIRANISGQLAYQTNIGFYGLAVTEIILNDIGINYDINSLLKEIIGVNIEEFTSFQSLITAVFVAREKYPRYTIDNFNNFRNEQNLGKLNQFLNYFSMSFNQLETFMSDQHKSIDNPEFEYNLLSPLIKKPLYRFDNNYVAYHKTILNHFCEYGLYDLIKSHDSSRFSGEFGHGFETYLTYSLNSLKINYQRESEIRKVFNVKNSVDFLYKSNNDVLLIEAKSSEMSELTPHNPEKRFLEQTFQNSLVKGYKQIILTVNELKKQNPNSFNKCNFWALIVTFKDFMFGAPEAIWLEFMEEKMKELLPTEIYNKLPIDPLKIFVVSVYEFDSLCLFTKRRDSDLIASLKIPYENNKERETKKFSFTLHYPQHEITLNDFDHIKTKLDIITKRMKKYIK